MTKALAAIMVVALTVTGFIAIKVGAQGQASKIKYMSIPGGDYKIDPAHSIIGFAIRHFEINWVEGRFKDFEGVIHFDEADVTKSSVEFTAKIESIDTGVAQRDQHLRTPDFFDAAKFPVLTFKSSRVERKGKTGYILHGEFTLKGVTKPIALPFTMAGAIKDPRGGLRFGVEAHTKISRRDYGFSPAKALEGGGLDIGDEVTINLNLEALKIEPKAAGQ